MASLSLGQSQQISRECQPRLVHIGPSFHNTVSEIQADTDLCTYKRTIAVSQQWTGGESRWNGAEWPSVCLSVCLCESVFLLPGWSGTPTRCRLCFSILLRVIRPDSVMCFQARWATYAEGAAAAISLLPLIGFFFNQQAYLWPESGSLNWVGEASTLGPVSTEAKVFCCKGSFPSASCKPAQPL